MILLCLEFPTRTATISLACYDFPGQRRPTPTRVFSAWGLYVRQLESTRHIPVCPKVTHDFRGML
jgi:hypothetical protein